MALPPIRPRGPLFGGPALPRNPDPQAPPRFGLPAGTGCGPTPGDLTPGAAAAPWPRTDPADPHLVGSTHAHVVSTRERPPADGLSLAPPPAVGPVGPVTVAVARAGEPAPHPGSALAARNPYGVSPLPARPLLAAAEPPRPHPGDALRVQPRAAVVRAWCLPQLAAQVPPAPHPGSALTWHPPLEVSHPGPVTLASTEERPPAAGSVQRGSALPVNARTTNPAAVVVAALPARPGVGAVLVAVARAGETGPVPGRPLLAAGLPYPVPAYPPVWVRGEPPRDAVRPLTLVSAELAPPPPGSAWRSASAAPPVAPGRPAAVARAGELPPRDTTLTLPPWDRPRPTPGPAPIPVVVSAGPVLPWSPGAVLAPASRAMPSAFPTRPAVAVTEWCPLPAVQPLVPVRPVEAASPPPPPAGVLLVVPGVAGADRSTITLTSLEPGGDDVSLWPAGVQDLGLEWRAGEQVRWTLPLTPGPGRRLSDWDSVVLTIRQDPLWPRQGADLFQPLDPHQAGDAPAVQAIGTVDAAAGTGTFAFAVPTDPGFRRYALDVRGVGGAAGEVSFLDATWLSVKPGVR